MKVYEFKIIVDLSQLSSTEKFLLFCSFQTVVMIMKSIFR